MLKDLREFVEGVVHLENLYVLLYLYSAVVRVILSHEIQYELNKAVSKLYYMTNQKQELEQNSYTVNDIIGYMIEHLRELF